jgi:hypothetical protein
MTNMGEWQKYYEEFLKVNVPPFVGSVHVAYQPLVQLSGKEWPKAFPAWERLVIWKSQNSDNVLSAQTPHVNTDVCLRKLTHARLHGQDTPRGLNLYLVDYTSGQEVFRALGDSELPENRDIPGLPSVLQESDSFHKNHPSIEEVSKPEP